MRSNYFWRKRQDNRQDAANMRSRPPMKHSYVFVCLSLLAIPLVGAGCNQNSTTKLDGGVIFDVATLTVSPTASAFPNTAIGADSPVQKFTLTNIGVEPTGPVSHVIDGGNSLEFIITGSTCA